MASVKETAQENGAVLIFDEMVTGFRLAKGGAQEYFGVTPDLATFGKAMANGFPLSAIVGRVDIMRLMEEVFFSLTYGGETLSLAAAVATMTKINTQPVIQTMARIGMRLKSGIERRLERHDVGHILSISGHPAWTFVGFKNVGVYTDWQIRTLFIQEMLARGILTFGVQLVSYAHSEPDVDRLLAVYDEVLPILVDAVRHGSLERHLRCEPLEPLFKLR